MAEKSFCFNSVNGDRKYKAEDFRDYFASFIGNGVFPNPSDNLQVMGENSDMTVTLKAGKAWINGAFYVNDADLILPIDVADGVLNRIDRIVLRLDIEGRAINAVVKKGTFASSPVAPNLQRDADAYELAVADILVSAGATSITQANITDLRLDNDLCGVVHGTVEQVDTTTLFNQYTAGFLNWFNTIKGQLSTDVAGNLQNQISDLDTEKNIYPASGTTNTITVTTANGDYSYTQFKRLSIKAASDNTGNVTINVDNQGAVPALKYNGSQLDAGQIKAGKVYDFYYDTTGNCFFLIAKASGNTVAAHVLAGDTCSTDMGEVVGTMDLKSENIKKGVIYGGIVGTLKELKLLGGTNYILFEDDYKYIAFQTTPQARGHQVTTQIGESIMILFSLRADNSGHIVYGQIYKNNNPAGLLRTTNSTSYVAFSEIFTCQEGDIFQLYLYTDTGSNIYANSNTFVVSATLEKSIIVS